VCAVAVALSVCIGVRGCGWPSSTSICHIKMAVFILMNRALNSVSTVDDMTPKIICEILRMAPLLKGMQSFPAMNMCLHAPLQAVDCKDHVACMVGEYCMLLCSHVIQELFT
jgi:hypothetical protein